MRGARACAICFEDGKAACTNKFVQDWARSHGMKLRDPCAAPEWYRQDEAVAKIIADQGKLGTGK